MFRRSAAVFALLACLAGVPAVAEPAGLSAARIAARDAGARVDLELSAAPTIELSSHGAPYRHVLRLGGARLAGAPVRLAGAGPIAAARLEPDGPGVRLTIELARPANLRALNLARPDAAGGAWRLALELEPVTAAAFRVAHVRVAAPLDPPRPAADLATPARRARPLIVLDPGHGGEDPGATSRSGVAEKTITLAVARHLAARLRAGGKVEPRLTRDADAFVPLQARREMARRWRADLLLSIHADSIRYRRVSGVSVYTLSDAASDAEAEALARRENRAGALPGLDLVAAADGVAAALIDLAQRETGILSLQAARLLAAELSGAAPLLTRPLRTAGFTVLRAPDVPSALVELGFLSNRDDERRLLSSEARQALVEALARGIERWVGSRDAALF